MRIVIATPLYPPEIADAAAYTKELARRLVVAHTVTVVAYTHLPEHVPGVTVITVDKRRSRLSRLLAFRAALARALKDADALIAVNGASVELPLLFTKRPHTIFWVADKAAHARAGVLERLASGRAHTVVHDLPLPRPEILPLEPEPREALAAYEQSWESHLKSLTDVLHGN